MKDATYGWMRSWSPQTCSQHGFHVAKGSDTTSVRDVLSDKRRTTLDHVDFDSNFRANRTK